MSNQLAVKETPPSPLNSNTIDGPVHFTTIEQFNQYLSREPNRAYVEKTPDGKAETLVISHVEALLDELFLMHWGVTDERATVVLNELMVSVQLWVIHPITKNLIERVGVAAITIMADKASQEEQNAPGYNKNAWALDINHKKPNALKLNYPAVFAMAKKNAAKSLGTVFGRNLNRKFEDNPEAFFTEEAEKKDRKQQAHEWGLQLAEINDTEELKAAWAANPEYAEIKEFKDIYIIHHNRIKLNSSNGQK